MNNAIGTGGVGFNAGVRGLGVSDSYSAPRPAGKALALDGVDDNTTLTATLTGSTDRTIEIAIKLPATTQGWGTSQLGLFSLGPPGTANADFTLRYYGNTVAANCYLAFNGWSNDRNFFTALPTVTWLHLATVYGSGMMGMYQDGALINTLNNPTAISGLNTAATTPTFGTDYNGNRSPFRYGMVRVWTVARTPAQLAAGIGVVLGPTAGLWGEWDMSGSGTTIADTSGNGRTMTIMGGAIRIAA